MMAWKLWRALRYRENRHPLFQQTSSKDDHAPPSPTSSFFMWMFTLTGLGFCWTIVFDWLPVLVLTVLLFANTVYSAIWSANISRTIVEEKASKRYDLLAALPVGSSGATWAMCTGYLHGQSSFRWIPFMVRMLSIITLLTLLTAIAFSLIVLRDGTMSDIARNANINVMATAVGAVILVIVFYVDHLYSIVIAALAGMLAPVNVLSSAEARLRATGSFLFFQLITYLFCWLIVVTLPAQIIRQITVGSVLVQGGMGLMLFISLRELTVRFLWQNLLDRLNAGVSEFDSLLIVRTD